MKAMLPMLIQMSLFLGVGIPVHGSGENYNYDDLNRLEEVRYHTGTSLVSSFDKAGNRRSETNTVLLSFETISDQIAVSGEPTGNIQVVVAGANDLWVQSSKPSLIGSSAIAISGGHGSWSLVLTSQAEKTGTVELVVYATNGTVTIAESFEVVVQDAVTAGIQNRRLFYNNSSFDTLDDSDAIATDKVALLPGGKATFSNYSSYSRGINGVMVDISGLANPSGIDANDFQFRVGNSDDLNTWIVAPAPSNVRVEIGSGHNGSDRIWLEWNNNSIENQWLEVTVLANIDTGLEANDVFYFGNAIGDTGNSAVNTQVDLIDQNSVRGNQRDFLNPAPIDFDYDFDRDGFVNLIDKNIVRGHHTNFLTQLRLVDLSANQGASLVTRTKRIEGLKSDSFLAIETEQTEASVRLGVRRSDQTGGLIIEADIPSSTGARLQYSTDLNGNWHDLDRDISHHQTEFGKQTWLVFPNSEVILYRLLLNGFAPESVPLSE